MFNYDLQDIIFKENYLDSEIIVGELVAKPPYGLSLIRSVFIISNRKNQIERLKS